MQETITDRAAIQLSRTFYRALASGLPVDAAVAEARLAISVGLHHSLEWGTPILYLRAPESTLFILRKGPIHQPGESASTPLAAGARGGSADPSSPSESSQSSPEGMKQAKAFQSLGGNGSPTSAPAHPALPAIASVSEKSAVQHFIDNDVAYLQWIATHQDGFVVNCYRNPTPAYLTLHRATCPTISKLQANAKEWTKDYGKVCSLSRTELQTWAEQKVHGSLRPCGLCHP